MLLRVQEARSYCLTNWQCPNTIGHLLSRRSKGKSTGDIHDLSLMVNKFLRIVWINDGHKAKVYIKL